MRRIVAARRLSLIAPTMAQDDEQIIDLTGKAAKISGVKMKTPDR